MGPMPLTGFGGRAAPLAPPCGAPAARGGARESCPAFCQGATGCRSLFGWLVLAVMACAVLEFLSKGFIVVLSSFIAITYFFDFSSVGRTGINMRQPEFWSCPIGGFERS